MKQRFDLIVVGAGIAGLSTAWRLAREGVSTLVIDAGAVGSGASHAAAGYLEPALEPGPVSDLEWASLHAFPKFVEEVERAAGRDVDFRTDGQVRIAYEETAEELIADCERRKAAGWRAELVQGRALHDLEPALSPQVAVACYLPEVAWVDGRKLCAALAEAIRGHGGTILEGRRVEELVIESGSVTGVRAAGGDFAADTVVIAAGWRTDEIDGLPAEVPPSVGVRGVILTLGMDASAPVVGRLVKTPGGVLCPRNDGRLMVGVTRERGRYDAIADAGSVSQLIQGAVRAVPACRDLPFLEAVCAFRPYLENDELLVRAARDVAGLYYSLGHGADGYLRCAAASAELARLVLRRNA